MDVLNVGIIGVGNMGSAHAKCISSGGVEGMKLAAVCDVDVSRMKPFTSITSLVKEYQDYKELLDDSSIDAVIIAVPHPLHTDIAIEALANNKHVLLEKPADITVSKVKKLNEAAAESDKVFGIMFNQRTNPLFRKAKEIVENGELGELKRTVWIITNWYRTQKYYDSGEWRATWAGEGGGVLLNQAPHNLDLWQWICGMPESVVGYCDIAKYHDIEVEDDATIFTRYKNGAVGTFITSTGEYPGTNRLEISGDLGKIVLENGVLKWWKLKQSERDICANAENGFVDIDHDYIEIEQDAPETAHKGILQNFTDAILHGERLIAPGVDGIHELTLSNAAYLSSWKNNQEIVLPFDEKEFDKCLEKLAKTSEINKSEIKKDISSSEYNERWKIRW